jgi:hypothetical protein
VPRVNMTVSVLNYLATGLVCLCLRMFEKRLDCLLAQLRLYFEPVFEN